MSITDVPEYLLPPALIGRADVARLEREVEAIDNDFETQKVRDHRDEEHYAIPNMSRGLTDFLTTNKVNITDAKERTSLKERLRVLKDKAPVVHVTFAVDADAEFLQELVNWMRTEIHPQSLLSVGLQPSLVGGMYMRTPNHVHDFSLREVLAEKRDILAGDLAKLTERAA